MMRPDTPVATHMTRSTLSADLHYPILGTIRGDGDGA